MERFVDRIFPNLTPIKRSVLLFVITWVIFVSVDLLISRRKSFQDAIIYGFIMAMAFSLFMGIQEREDDFVVISPLSNSEAIKAYLFKVGYTFDKSKNRIDFYQHPSRRKSKRVKVYNHDHHLEISGPKGIIDNMGTFIYDQSGTSSID